MKIRGEKLKVRPIDATDYNDVTSIYGYTGTSFKFENNFNPQTIIYFFKEQFFAFCKEHKIISFFSKDYGKNLMSKEILLNDFGNHKSIEQNCCNRCF